MSFPPIAQRPLRSRMSFLSAVHSPVQLLSEDAKPGAEGAHGLTEVGPRAFQAYGANAVRSSLLRSKYEATVQGTFERSRLV